MRSCKTLQNAAGRVPLRPARLTTCPTEGSGLRPIQSRFSLHDVPYPQQNRFLILVGCSEGSFGSVAALAGITTGMSTPRSPARAALGLAMCGPRQVHLVVGLHARFTLSCNLLLRRLSPFVRLQPSAGRLRLRRRP